MLLNECVDFLKIKSSFVLLTHRRPDGDTIGSAGALCLALRAMGKEAFLFPNAEFTKGYMKYVEPLMAPDGYVPEAVVAIDTATPDLFPCGFEDEVDICIDHHPSNSGYAKHNIVWDKRASCGELVFEIIKALGVEVTKEIAEYLYVAVSTDTGCFCYANTSSETLRAAADIIDCGVDNGRLNKELFRAVSRARLTLEGLIFSSLEIYCDNKVVIAVITKDMMEKAGTTEDDCDDIASLPGRLAGSRVSATIKEKGPDETKISMRSTRAFNSNEICAQFGGGGHAMAAGCTIRLGYKEAKKLLLDAIFEALG